ncbi:hypothetical protein ES703_52606 [subsurface metagenome]
MLRPQVGEECVTGIMDAFPIVIGRVDEGQNHLLVDGPDFGE